MNNKWYDLPVTSPAFKNGFKRFAFTSDEQAADVLRRYFRPDELEGAEKIPDSFGNGAHFVVYLPNSDLRAVVGKTKFCNGFCAGWIRFFAVREPFYI